MSTRVLHAAFIVTDSLKQRFFSKTVGSSTGCMIWTGAVQRNSYGAFKVGHQKIDAHVASWRITNGGIPVPLGQLVMHSCDCRMCVNPEHLQLGTVSENMLHAHECGRGEDFKSQGEDHYNAKLTEDLVRKIRALYVPFAYGCQRIANELGLTEAAVRSVVRHKSWKHVTLEAAQ